MRSSSNDYAEDNSIVISLHDHSYNISTIDQGQNCLKMCFALEFCRAHN